MHRETLNTHHRKPILSAHSRDGESTYEGQCELKSELASPDYRDDGFVAFNGATLRTKLDWTG